MRPRLLDLFSGGGARGYKRLRDRVEVLEVIVNERTVNLEVENARLRQALKVAADDLGKAANQFAGLKAAYAAGHNIPIVNNPEVFEAKEQRARAALDAHEGGRR